MSGKSSADGFSLVEVVLAIGVIAIAIIGILGVVPAGLNASHAAQDESRAPQIAQDIFSSIESQSQARYPNATIQQPLNNFSYGIDLSQSITHIWMSADNDGSLVIVDPTSPSDELKHPYQIKIIIAPDPPGYDPGYASQVTIRIATPPLPNPNQAPAANQTVRDFVRIISKY